MESVAVDSGFQSDDAYRFRKAREHRNVFAIKGVSETGKPIVGRVRARGAADPPRVAA